MESKNLLQTFWSLSSTEEEERIEAAKELFGLLKQHQSSSTVEGACQELKYTVQRLVRGLASSRKGARHGYYTALTEVVAQFPQLSVVDILQLIQANLEPSKGSKSAEIRGASFGKVFGFLSLVSSGVAMTVEDKVGVVTELVSLGKEKAYLTEFNASVLCQLLETCSLEECRDHIIPKLELEEGWENCSPERLQLILYLKKTYGKEVWFKSHLGDHWGSKNFWTSKNYDKMTGPLLDSSSSIPRLHGVWPLVLDDVRVKVHFGKFWKIVVDDGLMGSSHERKFVAFQLIEHLLVSSLKAEEVGVVFSPNLMSCLFNNSHSTGNYLHSAARHLINGLVSMVESSEDQKLLTTLLVHLQRRTNGRFDSLTGSKVIHLLTEKIKDEGIYLMLQLYQKMLTGQYEEAYSDDIGEGGPHKIPLWGMDQVLGLVRNPRLPRSGPWILSAASLLLGHTFFSITGSCDPKLLPLPLFPSSASLEPSLQEASQLRWHSILTDLSSLSLPLSLPLSPREGVTTRSPRCPPGMMESGESFITALFQVARKLVRLSDSEDGISQIQPFSKQVCTSWNTVCDTMESLSKETGRDKKDNAFLLLFSVAGLGLLPLSDREQHCQIISELEACWNEMREEFLQVKKQKTPVKRRRTLQRSKWMEVLTDLLLGQLSQPSQLWRINIEQSFKLLTGSVNSECLQLILAVLKPKQSVEDVMEEEGGEEEEEEEGNEEEEEEKEEEEEDGENSSSSGEEEEEVVNGVDAAFSDEVRRALGSAAAVNSDGESEASLDDDAMMAIDDALGQVFRTRFAIKHRKKQQKDDDMALLHFKLRVLDLVDVLLRRESTNPIIFDLILPLCEVVQVAQSMKSHAPLVEKAAGIFINRLCHAKEYPKSGVDQSSVHDILHQLIQDGLYKATPTTSPVVIAGAMFLVRVLRGSTIPPHVSPLTTRAGRKRKLEEKEEERGEVKPDQDHGLLCVPMVTQWLSDALHDCLTVKNSSVPPHFFTTYIERYPGLAGLLIPTMIQDLPNSANHFKRTQALEMLAVLTGGEGEGLEGLAAEDMEAITTIVSKTKRRKRPKRKKQRTS